MSQEQATRAKQQLYEDTSARDELTDDEAAVLLKWGEGQIETLAAQELDDAAFDEAYTHLRRVMTNINRFTGKRTYAPPEELKTHLDQLATEAGALGADVSAEALAAPQAQAADDNIALINQLTSLVSVDQSTLLNKLKTQVSQQVSHEAVGAPSSDQIDKLKSQMARVSDAGKLTAEQIDKLQSSSADKPDDKDEDEGLWGKILDQS